MMTSGMMDCFIQVVFRGDRRRPDLDAGLALLECARRAPFGHTLAAKIVDSYTQIIYLSL